MHVDLKELYPYYIRVAVVFSLLFHLGVFVGAPAFKPAPYTPRKTTEIAIEEVKAKEIEDIKEPEQIERPSMPVEAESEEEVEVEGEAEVVAEGEAPAEEQQAEGSAES